MDWTLPALKILLTGILFIVLSGVCVLLVTRIQRTLTVENKREHIVRLSNLGNFTSIFTLSIVSVEQMFSFKFLLNGIPLIAAPQVETFPAPSSDPGTTQSASSVQDKTENMPRKAGPNVNGVAKSGQAVAAKAGQAGSFLGTLASLLPGNLGSGLRAQSETLKQTQAKAQAASKAPENAQRKVQSLQQQSGRLVAVAPAGPAGSPPNIHRPATQSASAPVHSQAVESNITVAKKVVPGAYRVQTQPVEPGGSLSLTLRVEASKRSRPAGSYAYTLSSRQLPADALDGEEPPVTRQGILHFPHVDFWRYWLAPVASFLMIVIFMLTLIFVLKFVWQ